MGKGAEKRGRPARQEQGLKMEGSPASGKVSIMLTPKPAH